MEVKGQDMIFFFNFCLDNKNTLHKHNQKTIFSEKYLYEQSFVPLANFDKHHKLNIPDQTDNIDNDGKAFKV